VLEPATLLRSSVTLPSTVPAAFQVNANPGNWSQHDVRRSGVRVTLSILWRDAKGRQFEGSGRLSDRALDIRRSPQVVTVRKCSALLIERPAAVSDK